MVKVWWQYLAMFIVALVAGASFTILSFVPKDAVLETSATGKVVSAIMNARDVEVEFSLAFENENMKISADGTFVMDLKEETNTLDLDLKLNPQFLSCPNCGSDQPVTYTRTEESSIADLYAYLETIEGDKLISCDNEILLVLKEDVEPEENE